MKTIITHNGLFHADEVLAIALLRTFTTHHYEIIRTRDLTPYLFCGKLRKRYLALDVGKKFDNVQWFDHHQFDKNNPLHTYSSAGLIWKNLCESQYLNFPKINKLVKEVDLHDNGIQMAANNHFCEIISTFNPISLDKHNQDDAFQNALEFATRYVSNLKRKQEEFERFEKIASHAPVINGFLVSRIFFPQWKRKAIDLGCKGFIYFDKDQDCWAVQATPKELESFECVSTLEATGHSHEIFVHKNGFIGKYNEYTDKGATVISFTLNGETIVFNVGIITSEQSLRIAS